MIISSRGSAFPLSTKYNAQHRWIQSQSPSNLELWCVVARTARWTKRPFVCDLRPQTLYWCHVMAKPIDGEFFDSGTLSQTISPDSSLSQKTRSIFALNTLVPKRNGQHFANDIIFSNVFSWTKMHEFRFIFHWFQFLICELKNIPALVQIMAWRLPG